MKNLKITFFKTTLKLLFGILLCISCDDQLDDVMVFEETISVEQEFLGSITINPTIKDVIKITGKQPAPAIETLLENATVTIRTRNSGANIVLFDATPYSDLTWPMRISPNSYNIVIRSGNYVADAFFEVEENENETLAVALQLDGIFYAVNFSPKVVTEYPDISAEITISYSAIHYTFSPNSLISKYYTQLFSFEGAYWNIRLPVRAAELSITATENSGEIIRLNIPLSGATGLGYNKDVTFNIEFSEDANTTTLNTNITVTEANEINETVAFPPTKS